MGQKGKKRFPLSRKKLSTTGEKMKPGLRLPVMNARGKKTPEEKTREGDN